MAESEILQIFMISLKKIFDAQKKSYEQTTALLEAELNSFSEYFESHDPPLFINLFLFGSAFFFERKKRIINFHRFSLLSF